MDKIIVPLDGSKHSRKTLKFAINLAKKYPATITLIHVMRPLISFIAGDPDELILPLKSVDELDKLAETELEEAQKEAEKSGIDTDTVLLKGDPGYEIIKYAKEKHINLIILGNRIHSAIEEFLLGSVSHYVVDHSKCPTIIVK